MGAISWEIVAVITEAHCSQPISGMLIYLGLKFPVCSTTGMSPCMAPLGFPPPFWLTVTVPPLYSQLTIFQRLHFVLLSKLPSATETADLLVLYVFQFHGIPQDIVSDWRSTVFLSNTEGFLQGFERLAQHGQTMRANQDLESALCYVIVHLPSSFLFGFDVHITLYCVLHHVTFYVCSGFSTSRFPSSQRKLLFPLLKTAFGGVARCVRLLVVFVECLIRTSLQHINTGSQVHLTNLDKKCGSQPMSSPYKIESMIHWTFEVGKVINPAAVRPKFVPMLKIHPTFHV